MKGKDDSIGAISFFVISIVLIIWGIKMIIYDLVAVGIYDRNLSLTGFGGEYLILMGLVFLVVAYYCLSPFGRIRTFLEGGNKRRKKTGKEKQEK